MIGVVLCGGAGSRLWPISRETCPKPFLRLGDNQSLLQKAFLRADAIPGMEEIITVTNRQLLFMVMEEYRATGIQLPERHILEPFGRNTAPAIAAAALEARRTHGDDVCLMVLAADHLITDQDAFVRAALKARDYAMDDKLVVFGIRPTGPETGYGYIEAEDGRVIGFVEKPTLEKAKHYVAGGRHFWNSGMFCFKAGVFLEELKAFQPEILSGMDRCLREGKTRTGRTGRVGRKASDISLNPDVFAIVPDISVDYAVMEKSDRISMVPCDMGWSDIGSWEAWNAMLPVDDDNNHFTMPEKALLYDTRNCDINSSRLVATLGVENLLIADTEDALLVADRSRAGEVRQIYNELKARNDPVYKQHNLVFTPWGSYTVLEQSPYCKIKKLLFKPGGRLSLQSHKHRNEHWIVVSGTADVTRGEEQIALSANESTYIRAGEKHRLANTSEENLILIEVQTGSYLGEDDIVRYEDIYKRIDD